VNDTEEALANQDLRDTRHNLLILLFPTYTVTTMVAPIALLSLAFVASVQATGYWEFCTNSDYTDCGEGVATNNFRLPSGKWPSVS
jgi:hypothetical protein